MLSLSARRAAVQSTLAACDAIIGFRLANRWLAGPTIPLHIFFLRRTVSIFSRHICSPSRSLSHSNLAARRALISRLQIRYTASFCFFFNQVFFFRNKSNLIKKKEFPRFPLQIRTAQSTRRYTSLQRNHDPLSASRLHTELVYPSDKQEEREREKKKKIHLSHSVSQDIRLVAAGGDRIVKSHRVTSSWLSVLESTNDLDVPREMP